MKKTIITLLALAGVAGAAPSLTTDFTTAPTDWTSGQWNGWNTPHFNYGENGAVIAQPWKQNTLSTAITLSPEEAITIEFSTFGNGNEQGLMFYLSSSTDNYSVVTGTSYNSNKAVDVGYLDKAIVPRTENGGSNMGNVGFQANTTNLVTSFGSTSGTTLSTFNPLTYTLTLDGAALTVSVKDKDGKTWSEDYTIKSDVTFDSIGFIMDGGAGNVGVKSISIIPEPTTATLSLLALAGLAARRRRASR